MEAETIVRSRRRKPYGFYKQLVVLTVAGGAVFWLATIATSVLPIAAKYRAAFSNWSIQTVWLASLPMGLIIACCVSCSFLRLSTKIPAKRPILKAVTISSSALAAATILIDVPMIFHAPGDSLYYFLVGVVFNTARFLLLGTAIGCLHKRLRTIKPARV